MRRPMVAGNWKMHGTRASVAELIDGLSDLALPSGVDVAVFPPLLHISQVVDGLKGKSISIGAQNSAVESGQGALTGEVSPTQLVDAGCSLVLVGHSERRQIMGEQDEEAFCFTYGDGVSDVDITASIAFHHRHGKLATVTAVQPPGRYGALSMQGEVVQGFTEKPRGDGGLINGGFFVLSPQVLARIAGDTTSWEQEPLAGLAAEGQLIAYEHTGFWQPMDTLREKNLLEELWLSGKAPWKTW